MPWLRCALLCIAGRQLRRNAAAPPASAAAAQPTWPCCGAIWPLQVASTARLCSLHVVVVILQGMGVLRPVASQDIGHNSSQLLATLLMSWLI